MKTKYKLENIKPYSAASELSDYIWKIVSKWDWFSKKDLGSQLTSSIDSIAGNIAEGFGRFHKKDKVKFYYNSRTSAFEGAHWIKRARQRGLLSKEESDHALDKLRNLPKEINILIKMTMEKLKL